MRRLAGVAALLAAALVGCDTVQEASDTVGNAADKVTICAEALRLAGFSPDASDPAKAAEDAKKTSDELSRLAGQTPDETLKQALNDVSRKVGEFRPENAAQWTREKVATVDALSRACA